MKVSVDNERWRRGLYISTAIFALVIFLLEFIMFFTSYDVFAEYFSRDIYMLRFLVMPSGVNLIALLVTGLMLRFGNYSAKGRDWIIAIAHFVVCAVAQCGHYVFSVLLVAPIAAIMASAVFGNRRLTLSVTLLSLFTLTIAGWLSATELRRDDPQLILDLIISAAFIFCSYGIAIITVRHEQKLLSDISENYSQQMTLFEENRMDPLTGVHNRRAFTERLEHSYSYGLNTGKTMYIAIFDIDDFKRINDTYGHTVGDSVLKSMAEIMSDECTGKTESFRYGGEEFVMIFPESSEAKTIETVETVRNAFAHCFDKTDLEGKFTISAGIAELTYECLTQMQWLSNADKALYYAKNNGKDKTVVYNDDIDRAMRSMSTKI